MKKFKKFFRLIKKNNKGFSLVELLVGVAILGIISIPLMNVFMVSTNTYVTGREIGEATLVAQNLAEKIELENFGDIISKPEILGGDNNTVPAYTDFNLNQYILNLSGLENGTSEFDAKITFNAGEVEGDVDSLYESINDNEIALFNSMDALFVQNKYIEGEDYQTSNDPDEISYEQVVNLVKYEAFWLSDEQLANAVTKDREIIINIEETEDGIVGTVVYEYEFVFAIRTTTASELRYNSETNPLECRKEFSLFSIPYDLDANNGRYPSVYLLYHPYYDNNGTRTDEVIRIENNINGAEKLPIEFYIIKQIDPNTPANYSSLEENYQAEIELVQPTAGGLSVNPYAMVYSNAGDNLTTDEYGDGTPPAFKWYNGINTYYPVGWEEALTGDIIPTSSDILKTEQVYRMYDVTIEIFKGSKNIYTLETTKLR